jgi:hypothetical protein
MVEISELTRMGAAYTLECIQWSPCCGCLRILAGWVLLSFQHVQHACSAVSDSCMASNLYKPVSAYSRLMQGMQRGMPMLNMS